MPRRRRTALRTARAREMARLLRACDASGETQAAFARRHDVTPGTLAWWRHALGGRRRRRDAAAARFVEVVTAPAAPSGPAPRFEVVLAHDVIVRVPVAFDEGALRRLLAVLAGAC